MLAKGLGWYQNRPLLAIGKMILEPRLYGICQIHSPSAEVNPRKAARALEVLNDISVIFRVADFRDSEKPDQLFFCHDAGTRDKFTVWAR